MDKSPDAFRTISEVATELDLPQHVLRFWETRFSQIKPMKRGGGRRYYRPEDVELLCGIRHLLYGEGYTIKGVQRILKEQGVRYVMDIWRESDADDADGSAAPKSARVEPALASRPSAAPEPSGEAPEDMPEAGPDDGPEDGHDGAGDERSGASGPAVQPPAAPAVLNRRQDASGDRGAPAAHADAPGPQVSPSDAPRGGRGIVQERTPAVNGNETEPMPRDVLADDDVVETAAARSSFRFMERLRGGEGRRDNVPHEAGQQLAKDDIRRLQATLFELLECKRLLDQAR